jgi:hypothetical protein
VTAWQHPTDLCRACEQEILLRPEITPDLRLLYVRYCAHCDGGEPVAVRRERIPASQLETEIWGPRPEPEPTRERVDAVAAAAAMWTEAPGRGGRAGPDLWWNGDGDVDGDGERTHMTSMDARWARFIAPESGDVNDDAIVASPDGTFAFGADTAGKRRSNKRRPSLRLRRSA